MYNVTRHIIPLTRYIIKNTNLLDLKIDDFLLTNSFKFISLYGWG